jgi:DNA-binding MarR family transcriptional regulator
MNSRINPRHLLAERRRRDEHFPGMTEPAWFMLLGLVVAGEEARQLTVTEGMGFAFVPATSAHRHLTWLVEDGMVERTADPGDGRRYFLSLTAAGARKMAAYLQGGHERER